jgi:hypothetical protein
MDDDTLTNAREDVIVAARAWRAKRDLQEWTEACRWLMNAVDALVRAERAALAYARAGPTDG